MRYLSLEELVLALVITLRKFMHYFKAHPIVVYIEFSLKNMLMKLDLFGRLSNWVVDVRQVDVKFFPKEAIKDQVLTNFVASTEMS